MSMLAERRVKQKIGPDPNNKNWKNDKEKFGHKMLEKFGWSEGGGLGANLQGDANNIQLKANRSQKGLGSKGVSDDNWLGHQDCFDEILASLNADHAKSKPKADDESKEVATTADRRSLEQQCTKIRYLKFARGKDLNSKNEELVQEVLGKRSKRRRKEDREAKKAKIAEEPEVKVENDDDAEESKEENAKNMTTSNVSVNDYYKNKMAAKLAKLKGKR